MGSSFLVIQEITEIVPYDMCLYAMQQNGSLIKLGFPFLSFKYLGDH